MPQNPERSQESPAPQREPRQQPSPWSARPAPGGVQDPVVFPFSRSPEEDEVREMYGWGV